MGSSKSALLSIYVLISRISTEYKYELLWIKVDFVGFFKIKIMLSQFQDDAIYFSR